MNKGKGGQNPKSTTWNSVWRRPPAYRPCARVAPSPVGCFPMIHEGTRADSSLNRARAVAVADAYSTATGNGKRKEGGRETPTPHLFGSPSLCIGVRSLPVFYMGYVSSRQSKTFTQYKLTRRTWTKVPCWPSLPCSLLSVPRDIAST